MLQQEKHLQQEQEKGASIDDLIKKSPLLLNKHDPAVIKVGEYYLPYSTGFEIECSIKQNTSKENFEHIDELLDLDINSFEEYQDVVS